MKFELSPRRVFAGFALIPLALLAEALILQHLKGQVAGSRADVEQRRIAELEQQRTADK